MDRTAIHFSIGRSEEFFEMYNYNDKLKITHNVLEGNYDPVHRVITEPFTDGGGCWCAVHYIPYYVFGIDEIKKSDFKYCQYEHYETWRDHDGGPWICEDLCKYLSAFSIYPRQIEMLMKTGGKSLVMELVSGRRKNREIIKWKADNPYDAFSLDKAEFRDFRESGCEFKDMVDYKKLRRHKLQTSFARLHEIDNRVGVGVRNEIVKSCISYGIHPDKLVRYLDRFTGVRCFGGEYTLSLAYQNWCDYVSMAKVLDYDLSVETVLMPRNLDLAHHEANCEIDLKLQRENRQNEKALKEKEKISLLRRMKKYNIELDGYFIRIAESPREIAAEGKTLVHCVGGYAERHMSEATTILFLRRSDAPDISLYTIQMDGNVLRQIHGYKNERLDKGKMAPDPRETMRWILDPWLEWLAKGSPRRKDGTARLPKYKEAKTA